MSDTSFPGAESIDYGPRSANDGTNSLGECTDNRGELIVIKEPSFTAVNINTRCVITLNALADCTKSPFLKYCLSLGLTISNSTMMG